jgi:hypothetical protein
MRRDIRRPRQRFIFAAQVASVALIWVFVIAIAMWIGNLIQLSIELKDSMGATLGISIVAVPVFFALAGVLTYVFVGLQKERIRYERSMWEE